MGIAKYIKTLYSPLRRPVYNRLVCAVTRVNTTRSHFRLLLLTTYNKSIKSFWTKTSLTSFPIKQMTGDINRCRVKTYKAFTLILISL